MQIQRFPWLALGLGLLFALILLQTKGYMPQNNDGLPLLMRLFMSEFAFLLNAAGVFLSVRDIRSDGPNLSRIAVAVGCLMLAGFFLYVGILLWPVSG